MESFLLITNRHKDKELAFTNEIKSYLESKNKSVKVMVPENRTSGNLLEDGELFDCIVVLGGDGTILRTAKLIENSHIPMIGINMGHIGYLAEVERENYQEVMDALCDNTFELEDRMMLSGHVIRDGKVIFEADALNDVVITRGGFLQVLNYEISVNGKVLKQYKADGVILATPTGSTAYNLYAGGPVIAPGADVCVVTPISPHTMMNKSFVLRADNEVSVRILAPHSADLEQLVEVNFDGCDRVKLQENDCVVVSKSEKTVTLIRMNQLSFLETLHRKMIEE